MSQYYTAKCTKFDFGWVSALDPIVDPPDLLLLAGCKGPTFNRKGRDRREG